MVNQQGASGSQEALTCDAVWPTQVNRNDNWRNAVQLFEGLASATWSRLGSASELESPFGEVTISQINMLDIRKSGNLLVRINATTPKEESKLGVDFDLFVGSYRRGVWWRYCIQAKKLSLPRKKNWSLTQTYPKLDYKLRNGSIQLELLDSYSQRVGGIPLYCFYNYSLYPGSFLDHWHCKGPEDQTQFGCTVAPLSTVRNAIIAPKRSFAEIHQEQQSLPWRCLIRCPRMAPSLNSRHPLAIGRDDPRLYDSVPQLLDFPGIQVENASDFPSYAITSQELVSNARLQEFYPDDLEVLPKWVGIIEI